MCDLSVTMRARQYAAVTELLTELWTHNGARQWSGRNALGLAFPVYRLRPSRVTYVCAAFRVATGATLYYERTTDQ